jgi:hypothetical protein
VSPPYFGFIRDLIRRAEGLAANELSYYPTEDHRTTGRLYEQEALTNIIGELECVRAECERRIRYLEAKAGENI